MASYRVGLVVPSSNTTMETEIPAMLRRRSLIESDAFTFHSSRARLKRVTKDELDRMVSDADRCALELSDARVDVIAYACLVALMAQPAGFHCLAENRLAEVASENGAPVPVVSSAGALVRALQVLGVRKVGLIAPYLKPIAQQVVDYLGGSDIEVVDWIALEISDNLEVGRFDPARLPSYAHQLDLTDAEAVILSACVQMPSLSAIQRTEDSLGLPVFSAATATVYGILEALELPPLVPEAGSLLSGAHRAPTSRTLDVPASA